MTGADDRDAEEMAIVAAAQRDRAAFAPLYARYARPIYRFCYRQLGSHEAAEDTTSQTFVKALAALDRYRAEAGSFRSWLFTIADRVVTDRYRRARPHLDLDAAAGLESREPGPDESAIAAETARSVQTMLDRLTPDQRRVVALRLSGLTGPEIADVIGREHQAVKSLQFRAFARLRRLLEAETRMTTVQEPATHEAGKR